MLPQKYDTCPNCHIVIGDSKNIMVHMCSKKIWIKLLYHPDAFLKRWIIYLNGKDRTKMPFLDKELLQQYGAIIETRKGPTLISKDSITDFLYSEEDNNFSNQKENSKTPYLLTIDQIPRHTSYEKGFPLQYKEDPNENNLTPDPLVNDDQAIIVNVKVKFLNQDS